MKSYSNIVDMFTERYNVEKYVDEQDVTWYCLDDISKVIELNMEWYKHLFTIKIITIDDMNLRFITKAALVILLQITKTPYGEYLKLLGEYDAIRLKLDTLEDQLKNLE